MFVVKFPAFAVQAVGFADLFHNFLANSPKIIADVVPLSNRILIGHSFSFPKLVLTCPIRNGTVFFNL